MMCCCLRSLQDFLGLACWYMLFMCLDLAYFATIINIQSILCILFVFNCLNVKQNLRNSVMFVTQHMIRVRQNTTVVYSSIGSYAFHKIIQDETMLLKMVRLYDSLHLIRYFIDYTLYLGLNSITDTSCVSQFDFDLKIMRTFEVTFRKLQR